VAPDGTRLAVRGQVGEVFICPVAGGSSRQLPGLREDDVLVGWTRDGRALLFEAISDVPARLDRVDIDTGNRVAVTTIGPPDLEGAIQVFAGAVLHDGEVIAYSVLRQRSTLFEVTGLPR
jgi:hypothetical protein